MAKAKRPRKPRRMFPRVPEDVRDRGGVVAVQSRRLQRRSGCATKKAHMIWSAEIAMVV